jgi:hypothetical protein
VAVSSSEVVGPAGGIKGAHDDIRLASFMPYDLEFGDI